MLFHVVEKSSSMLAGASAGELKLRYMYVLAWLAATVVLFVLSLVAHGMGWDEGAGKILAFACTFGGGGAGLLLGEKSGAKSGK